MCGPSQVETALTFISYIGMSASIISLVFALIILLSHKSVHDPVIMYPTYNQFLHHQLICTTPRRIRQKTITKYHVQLSLALLLMLIVSLALVVLSAENIAALYGGCVTVSVLVHYFTLVAMMWMGAEALLMFQKLVLVFVQITTKYIIMVSVVCWGNLNKLTTIPNHNLPSRFLCVGLPIFFVLVPLIADLANGSAPWKDIVIKREGIPSL